MLAYQYGAGLCELLTPTNGALMAMLAASGVRYEDWLEFVVPGAAGPVRARGRRRSGWRWRSGCEPGAQHQADQPLEHLEVGDPTWRPRSFPRSKAMTVGIPRMPKRAAIGGLASVSSLSTSTSPACRLGEVVERRRHHLAGTAPVGVEVHQHRHARPC